MHAHETLAIVSVLTYFVCFHWCSSLEMHNTQYGKVDAELHVISHFYAPTPTHTHAGSHVCLTTTLPHIFKQKSYFPHTFILMLHNYFCFQIALQIQTLAHTHTHTESLQSLDFKRKVVFWVYTCMRAVNFPTFLQRTVCKPGGHVVGI